MESDDKAEALYLPQPSALSSCIEVFCPLLHELIHRPADTSEIMNGMHAESCFFEAVKAS